MAKGYVYYSFLINGILLMFIQKHLTTGQLRPTSCISIQLLGYLSQPMPVITNYATEPKGYYGKANLTISQVLYIELKCHYSPTMEGL